MELKQIIFLSILSFTIFSSGTFGQTESVLNPLSQTIVNDISAFYRDGQVFVTWDNLASSGIRYNLYRSSDPIQNGSNLTTAQYLGSVRDNSAMNQRLTEIFSETRYYKIDSVGVQLPDSLGLFVETSTEDGSF